MRKRWFHHFLPEFEVSYRLDRIERKLDLIHERQETLMTTFDDLKASQDKIVNLVGKVKTDVEALHAKIDSIPTGGMTPEQQAALDDAVNKAQSIVDSLSSVDDLTPEA